MSMRWVFYPLTALIALTIVGLATLTAMTLLAWPRLPSLETLTDYRPRIPLRVYTADGYLLGEFGEERRTVVDIDNVPAALKNAILATEDRRFYEHIGIDVVGIIRAAVSNLTSGGKGQGASTITMQVARNFFLSREKTYNRKLYEILLALKIERNLSKDQILELYINQIYLGQRAYGFSAAARTYYGKTLDNLTLAEAAMLAGLPQSPSAANPITNPHRAKQRQQDVLRRMLEGGFIDEAAYNEAVTSITALHTTPAPPVAIRTDLVHGDYVAEMARQIAVEQFGEDNAYQSGIKIVTTITRADQEAAYSALRQGIMDYDLRHGYRGPESFVDLPANVAPEQMDEHLSGIQDYDGFSVALVLDASAKNVRVYYRGAEIDISGDGLRFATPMLKEQAPQSRRIRRGAIIRIRNTSQKPDEPGWEITQLPEIQAALVSIDSSSGAVRALVGGFDFNRNKFNHVTQAQRQPGSSFKPFIYSAALERGYSPSSIVADEPLYFPSGVTGGQPWAPKNYDGKFDGLMTVRTALARSKNIVSIQLLQSITPTYAQDYISRFGFDPNHHPPYLTMALGAGSVTPWEMATGYAVFANGGYRIDPYIIKEMYDSNGKLVAKTDPPIAGESAPRVIDERNAWLMDSMMQDVVRRGTAGRARVLKRNDIAGKTGTTNDYLDAWFCGYNPDIVTITWMGFSQPKNMGRGETGGVASLPIWINYMRTALQNKPDVARPRPARLVATTLSTGETDYIYEENRNLHQKPEEDPLLELLSTPDSSPNEGEVQPSPQTPQPPQTHVPAPIVDRVPTPVAR